MDNKLDINAILNEIARLSNCKTDKELGAIVGLEKSALSLLRKRGLKNENKGRHYLQILESLRNGTFRMHVGANSSHLPPHGYTFAIPPAPGPVKTLEDAKAAISRAREDMARFIGMAQAFHESHKYVIDTLGEYIVSQEQKNRENEASLKRLKEAQAFEGEREDPREPKSGGMGQKAGNSGKAPLEE